MSMFMRRFQRSRKSEEPSGLSLSLTPSVNLTETEKKYLDAAHNGKLDEVMKAIEEGGRRFNLNCVDFRGRSALSLAVEEEHFLTINYLLGKCKLNVIEDALLNAIRYDRVKVAELILSHETYSDKRKRLRLEFEHGFYDQEESASSFSPDITPIVLASQNNQFDITHILLQQGFKINDPHTYFCVCTECKNHRKLDKVVHSRTRLNAYRGLCSAAYLCLSSDDPILVAFERSKQLERLAEREKETKHEYKMLSLQCKSFAVDMLDLCRTQEEVMAAIYGADGDLRDLSRMKLAIRYEQKNFIAHSSLQEHLADIWYQDLPWFRHLPFVVMVFIVPMCMSLMPLMAIVYFFAPNSKTGKLVSSPLVKFLNHSAAYFAFLLLLFIATTRESISTSNAFSGTDGIVTLLILVFICGFLWTEMKQVYLGGVRHYLRDMWNFIDMTMLCLYLGSYGLEILMYFKKGGNNANKYTWVDTGDFAVHPRVVSIILFSVANVLSFARVAYMLPASESFGQLQISYGRMLQDVAKFMFVYVSVMLAFMCGLTSLYSMNKNENAFFTNLQTTLGTLFFAAFGMGDSNAAVIKSHGGHSRPEDNVNDMVVQYTGTALYGVYIIGAVVVLVNMLIAMMSNTFEEIRDDEDVEWKFARARLWLSYLERGNTLPVPFNVIPTPKSICRLIIDMKDSVCGTCRKKKTFGFENGFSEKSDTMVKSKYKEIMHRVVLRYINNVKFEKKRADVLKEEINEVRDDLHHYLERSLTEIRSKLDSFSAMMENMAKLVEPANNHALTLAKSGTTEPRGDGNAAGYDDNAQVISSDDGVSRDQNGSSHAPDSSSGSSTRWSDDRIQRTTLKSRQQLRAVLENARTGNSQEAFGGLKTSQASEILLIPDRLQGRALSKRLNDSLPQSASARQYNMANGYVHHGGNR